MSSITSLPSFSEWCASAQRTISTHPSNQTYPQPESEITPQPAPARQVQRTFEPQISTFPQQLLSISNPLTMQIPFEAIKKNIEERLRFCPKGTYCRYDSPTPNLHYLFHVSEISNVKYIFQWKISEIAHDLFQVSFSSGTFLLYNRQELEEMIEKNFQQSLVQCEAKRKEEAIATLSTPDHCDASPKDKDLSRRFESRQTGSYIIYRLGYTPIFTLFFINYSHSLIQKNIIVEETGFLLVGNQRYQNFEHLASQLRLKNSLLILEIMEPSPEKVVDEISEKTETKEKPGKKLEEKKRSDSDSEISLLTQDRVAEEMKPTKFSETMKPPSAKKVSPEDEKLIAEVRASYEGTTKNRAPKIIIKDGRPIFCPTPVRP